MDVGRLTQLYHAQRRLRRLQSHAWQLRGQLVNTLLVLIENESLL